VEVNLIAGIWTLTVTAYYDGDPMARFVEEFTLASGDDEELTAVLRPIRQGFDEGATGTFAWNLTFPAGTTVTRYVHSVDPSTGVIGSVIGAHTVTNPAGASWAGNMELPVADYFVVFRLVRDGYQTLVFGRDLHIFWNMTNTFPFTFAATYFISEGAERWSLRNELPGATNFGALAPVLVQSGSPAFTIDDAAGIYYLHVGNRTVDSDAIDIDVAQLIARGAETGDVLTIRGCVDGVPPSGAQIQLQTMPGFGWIGGTAVNGTLTRPYSEFSLSWVLGDSGTPPAAWSTRTHLRLQSNAAGATMNFWIYDIIVSSEAPDLAALPIPPPVPFVTVGTQEGMLQEGTAGSATFPVTVGNWTTSGIDVDPVTITGLPAGLAASVLVENITAIGAGGNGTGTLTITGTPGPGTANAPAGAVLTLTLNGASDTFTLTVSADGSDVADLAVLTAGGTDVMAGAAAGGFGHTMEVAEGVVSIALVATAECEDAGITVTRNGTTVSTTGTDPYHVTATVALERGLNVISVTVTAEAGNTKTYTVSVFRNFAAPGVGEFNFQTRLADATPNEHGSLVPGITHYQVNEIYVREFGAARFIDANRVANWRRVQLVPADLGLGVGDEVIVHGRVCLNAVAPHAPSHMWMALGDAGHVGVGVPNHAADVPAGGAFTLRLTLASADEVISIRGNQYPRFFIEHIEVVPPGDTATWEQLIAGGYLSAGGGASISVVGGAIATGVRGENWEGINVNVAQLRARFGDGAIAFVLTFDPSLVYAGAAFNARAELAGAGIEGAGNPGAGYTITLPAGNVGGDGGMGVNDGIRIIVNQMGTAAHPVFTLTNILVGGSSIISP